MACLSCFQYAVRTVVLRLCDMQGWTALHSAASCGHSEVVKVLLGLAADPDALTAQSRTPLHYATSKGWTEIVELLLQAGASMTMKDCSGATPLHRCAIVLEICVE